MPAYVAGRIGDGLNETGKAVNRANILVMGVSYEPDVADIRESPAVKVMAHLLRRGARAGDCTGHCARSGRVHCVPERAGFGLHLYDPSACITS